MGRKAKASDTADRAHGEVDGVDLDPIGVVKRELTRPDGSKVMVEVPVYPPFQLSDQPTARKPARSRSAPSLKRKGGRPSGSGGASS